MSTSMGFLTKRVVLFLLTLPPLLPTFAYGQGDSTIYINFRFPNPQVIPWGEVYSLVVVDSLSFTTQRGRPQLPKKTLLLKAPSGEPELEILKTEVDRLKLKKRILPAQGDSTDVGEGFHIDREFYNQDRYFPSEVVSLRKLGLFRGDRLLCLEVYPYRYNPRRGELLVYRQIGVSIYFRQREGIRVPQKVITGRPSGFGQYKILVDEDGIYHLSYDLLMEAGVNLIEIDPRTIRIYNKGREIPILVEGQEDGSFDPGDYIEFWGEFNRPQSDHIYLDPYSHINVYWLTWGGDPGKRMIKENGGILETDPAKYISPRSYKHTLHLEEDRHYDRLSHILSDSLRDHWFYDPGLNAGEQADYPIYIPYPDTSSSDLVQIQVMLQGKTVGEHQVEVFLGRQRILRELWSDRDAFLAGFGPGEGVSSDLLRHGDNVLNVINGTEGVIDNFMVNWFEITYPRLYWADEDFVLFEKPRESPFGLYNFTVRGFTQPEVEIYKLGISKILGGRVEMVTDSLGFSYYKVDFQDEVLSPGIRYVALTPSQKKSPKEIIEEEPSDLRSASNGADYIIIVHPYFAENRALHRLIDLRRGQGMRVKMVKVDDIYDEFNFGIPSPYAIKDFLCYAYYNWQPPPPSHILLVGDGSWDFKADPFSRGNFIPPYMRQTLKWGAAGCDHWYSLISGDDEIPDLFIGRFPVRTNEELNSIIAKIIEYEEDPPLGPWRNRLLFISGNGEVFRFQSEELIRKRVPPQYHSLKLSTTPTPDLNPDPFFGETGKLIHWIDEGLSLINFLGHGGGAIWSDNSLLRLQDVEKLNNAGIYPIVISMTCFTCAFEEPGRSCLGEELLKAKGKGAIAVWGASGVGWVWNDFYLVSELLDVLLNNKHLTLGQAIAEAKTSYLAKYRTPQASSMVNQYNLLGDPALRLPFPKMGLKLKVNNRTPEPGDTIKITGDVGFSEGRGQFLLVDANGIVLSKRDFLFSDGRVIEKMVIPADFKSGELVLKGYLYDDFQDAHGFISLTVGGTHFDHLRTIPASPTVEDSIKFAVQITDADGIKGAWCVVNSLSVDTLRMVREGSVFSTPSPLPPQPSGTLVVYYFVAEDSMGNRSTSERRSFKIPHPSDIALWPRDIFLSGEKFVRLGCWVHNLGDEPIEEVEVHFYQGRRSDRFIGADTLSLGARDEALAWVVSDLGEGEKEVYVVADPQNKVFEIDEGNNVAFKRMRIDRFNITPDLGTTLYGTGNDTVSLNDFSCCIPPKAVSSNGVLKIDFKRKLKIVDQPDLGFLEADPVGIKLSFAVQEEPFVLRKPAALWFQLTPSHPPEGGRLDIHLWDEATSKWIALGGEIENGRIRAQTDRLGVFAVIANSDRTPPRIELMVDGVAFYDGGFVSKRPEISALICDENGIDPRPGRIRVQIDGRGEEGAFTVSMENPNAVSLQLTPRLTPGWHHLSVQAYDCSGNLSAPEEVTFRVVEDFDVRVLGTYPNPFKDKTTFVYELTTRADELSIKIYSSSGRLIRKLDPYLSGDDPDPLEANYHEISWDGRDEWGDEVANGLYFYLIQAKREGKVVKKRGKVAKIK